MLGGSGVGKESCRSELGHHFNGSGWGIEEFRTGPVCLIGGREIAPTSGFSQECRDISLSRDSRRAWFISGDKKPPGPGEHVECDQQGAHGSRGDSPGAAWARLPGGRLLPVDPGTPGRCGCWRHLIEELEPAVRVVQIKLEAASRNGRPNATVLILASAQTST